MFVRSLVVESMQLGQFISDEVRCSLQPNGLSIQQFNVLLILRGCQEKPAFLKYITSRMIHKMSNTTRIVDKLLDKKLVNRKPCTENQRMVEINIAKAGLKLLTNINPLIDKKENEVESRLSEKELTPHLDNFKKLFVTL